MDVSAAGCTGGRATVSIKDDDINTAPVEVTPHPFTDNIERGLGLWDMTGAGFCHIDWTACVDGSCFWEGNAMVFDTSTTACTYYQSSGAATGEIAMKTDVAVVPLAWSASLTFFSYLDRGLPDDVAEVLISADSGATWNRIASFANTDCLNPTSVDLGAYIGKSIWIKFEFSSANYQMHPGRGWYLDEVNIVTYRMPGNWIAVKDVTVSEGSSSRASAPDAKDVLNTVSIALEVQLALASAKTVVYTTRDGTAVAGTDYEKVMGTFTVDPGKTSVTIQARIPILADHLVEPDKTFSFVVAGTSSGISFKNNIATVTIWNDDYPAGTTFEGAYGGYSWKSLSGTGSYHSVPILNPANQWHKGGDFAGFDYGTFYTCRYAYPSDTNPPTANKDIVAINTTTGATTVVVANPAVTPGDLAWDHGNGKLYGCSRNQIFVLDLQTKTLSAPITVSGLDASESLASIAVHPTTGRMYGLCWRNATNVAPRLREILISGATATAQLV